MHLTTFGIIARPKRLGYEGDLLDVFGITSLQIRVIFLRVSICVDFSSRANNDFGLVEQNFWWNPSPDLRNFLAGINNTLYHLIAKQKRREVGGNSRYHSLRSPYFTKADRSERGRGRERERE